MSVHLKMRRIVLGGTVAGLALIMTLTDAEAQRRSSATGRGAVAGGLTGAAIGSIAGGGRGAAIGAAAGLGVGSIMGSRADRRRGNHYWYNGRCWRRFSNGEFHTVPNRYCP